MLARVAAVVVLLALIALTSFGPGLAELLPR
jgi:hypothetical protein